jgi:predicted ABC-class ATPase
MSRPMIRIHDISTDKVVDREMTVKEFEEFSKAQELQASIDNAAITKKQEVLAKLGLTADEVAALLA